MEDFFTNSNEYCSYCGSRRKENKEKCENCGNRPTVPYFGKKCDNCGFYYDIRRNYCGKCGRIKSETVAPISRYEMILDIVSLISIGIIIISIVIGRFIYI